MTNIIQPMPELDPEQLATLRADIEANGVLVPVVIDQHGRIIDGNNRAAIAAELGMDYPTTTITVEDDQDAYDRAIGLNCARRHLNREQRRTLIHSEIRRRPDDSDRAIAKRIGTSASTVGAVRAKVSKLDSLAQEFAQCAHTMRVNAACFMVPLLSDPTVGADKVRVMWQTGMADLDGLGWLGRPAQVWARANVFQPMDDYLGNEWAADQQRWKDNEQRLPKAERTQYLDRITDILPMWAVVLRETWPDIFTGPADGWLCDLLAVELDMPSVVVT
jgi:hypothetical protein